MARRFQERHWRNKKINSMDLYEQNSYLLQLIQTTESRFHSYRLYCLTAYSVLTAIGVIIFFNIHHANDLDYALFFSFIILFITNIFVLLISLSLVRKASTDCDFFSFSLIKNEYNFSDPKIRYFHRFLKYREWCRNKTPKSLCNLLGFKKNIGVFPFRESYNKRMTDEEIVELLTDFHPFRAMYLANYIMFLLLIVWFVMLGMIIYSKPSYLDIFIFLYNTFFYNPLRNLIVLFLS